MTKYALLGLAAVLPALIQPACAESVEASIAQQVIAGLIDIDKAYVEVLQEVVDKRKTPLEGAEAITKVSAIAVQVMAMLGKMTDEQLDDFEQILSDPELELAINQLGESVAKLNAAVQSANYYDSAELKEACEAYQKNFE